MTAEKTKNKMVFSPARQLAVLMKRKAIHMTIIRAFLTVLPAAEF
jgi:hypothetical protein